MQNSQYQSTFGGHNNTNSSSKKDAPFSFGDGIPVMAIAGLLVSLCWRGENDKDGLSLVVVAVVALPTPRSAKSIILNIMIVPKAGGTKQC